MEKQCCQVGRHGVPHSFREHLKITFCMPGIRWALGDIVQMRLTISAHKEARF